MKQIHLQLCKGFTCYLFRKIWGQSMFTCSSLCFFYFKLQKPCQKFAGLCIPDALLMRQKPRLLVYVQNTHCALGISGCQDSTSIKIKEKDRTSNRECSELQNPQKRQAQQTVSLIPVLRRHTPKAASSLRLGSVALSAHFCSIRDPISKKQTNKEKSTEKV